MTFDKKTSQLNSSQEKLSQTKPTPNENTPAQSDSWVSLKSLTDARIGLGRAGVSIPTRAQLQFNLDHALARDAVNIPLNMEQLQAQLAPHTTTLRLHSRATERREYLQRPDLGRRLNQDSVVTLQNYVLQKYALHQTDSPDVALVLVDGLSSTGVQQHGSDLCVAIKAACKTAGLQVSPVCLVQQGRVAIGDEVGQRLHAKTTVLIVGERPGLSSPDSVGIYYTYGPKMGLHDASRNCISNIRPGGLSIAKATDKILWLIQESLKLKLSGVDLKDTSEIVHRSDALAADPLPRETIEHAGNFLLPRQHADAIVQPTPPHNKIPDE